DLAAVAEGIQGEFAAHQGAQIIIHGRTPLTYIREGDHDAWPVWSIKGQYRPSQLTKLPWPIPARASRRTRRATTIASPPAAWPMGCGGAASIRRRCWPISASPMAGLCGGCS